MYADKCDVSWLEKCELLFLCVCHSHWAIKVAGCWLADQGKPAKSKNDIERSENRDKTWSSWDTSHYKELVIPSREQMNRCPCKGQIWSDSTLDAAFVSRELHGATGWSVLLNMAEEDMLTPQALARHGWGLFGIAHCRSFQSTNPVISFLLHGHTFAIDWASGS